MRTTRMLRLLATLFILAVTLVAIPTSASATDEQDVERAQNEAEQALRELREANEALDASLLELQTVLAELDQLTWKTTQLRERVTDYQDEVGDLKDRAENLVIEAYMGGGNDLIEFTLGANSIQEVVTRQLILDQATGSDLISITRLEAVGREMDRLQTDLSTDLDRVEELRTYSELIATRMTEAQDRAASAYDKAKDIAADQLAKYEAEERRKRIEEERKRREEEARKRDPSSGLPPGVTPNWLCPVPSGRFINDWGFPRSGGRTHKGTDIFAPRGAKNVAVVAGSVRLDTYSLGGRIIWLRGDDGNSYYYAHLDAYASGLRSGQRVSKGQTIGYTGNTGNARTTSPHTHFQLHPGGGSAVNPYPTLAEYC